MKNVVSIKETTFFLIKGKLESGSNIDRLLKRFWLRLRMTH